MRSWKLIDSSEIPEDGGAILRCVSDTFDAILLAVWTAGPEPTLHQRLRHAGFHIEDHRPQAHGRTKGAGHAVWLARRKG